jgi:hypothetical protein
MSAQSLWSRSGAVLLPRLVFVSPTLRRRPPPCLSIREPLKFAPWGDAAAGRTND